jgi:hypothetical protein
LSLPRKKKAQLSKSREFSWGAAKVSYLDPKGCAESQLLGSAEVNFWVQRIWKVLQLCHHEAPCSTLR